MPLNKILGLLEVEIILPTKRSREWKNNSTDLLIFGHSRHSQPVCQHDQPPMGQDQIQGKRIHPLIWVKTGHTEVHAKQVADIMDVHE
jgi:hypothetical protein